ncbi:hypothetical protein Trydic_g9954 [Trypoxylus dichotomus]
MAFSTERTYMGLDLREDTKILATGGGSNNKPILQVLSDVFNAPVYVLDAANSAVLGAAYQAKHALLRDSQTITSIRLLLPEPKLLCQPYKDAAEIYTPMVERYRCVINTLTK